MAASQMRIAETLELFYSADRTSEVSTDWLMAEPA